MEILKVLEQIHSNQDPQDILFNRSLLLAQPLTGEHISPVIQLLQFPHFHQIIDTTLESHLLVFSINQIFNLKIQHRKHQLLFTLAQLINSKIKTQSSSQLWRILYFVTITKVWSHLKNTELEIATQEILRKSKNVLESDLKQVVHEMMEDLSSIEPVRYLNYAIMVNPTIFRNFTKPLQERLLKMADLQQDHMDLFSVLMLTHLESKQGSNSYQNQLKVAVSSLLDAIFICSNYVFGDTPNVLSDEFKKSVENKEGRFSVYQMLVEPIYKYKTGECINTQNGKCCQLLQSILKFMKDETSIELNFQMVLRNIGDSLLQSLKYFDLFALLENKNEGSVAGKSLQGILNSLSVERGIQFKLEEFMGYCKEQFVLLLGLLQMLLESCLSRNLMAYCSQIQSLFCSLVCNGYIRCNGRMGGKLNEVVQLLASGNYPVKRVIFSWCRQVIEELEMKLGQYVRCMEKAEKQSRTSGFVNQSKKGSSISLGLKHEHEYSLETLTGHIETALLVLESHSEFILTSRLEREVIVKLLRVITKMPSRSLNEKMQASVLSIMLRVVEYLPYSEHFEFNQIHVISQFARSAEQSEELGETGRKILRRIQVVKQVMKWSMLDNQYTVVSQFNELVNSQQRFVSELREEEGEPQKIKKVKSELVEQSEDIYYSIKEVRGEDEMPKAVFD